AGVGVHGDDVAEYGVDDPPGGLHRVLLSEEHPLTVEGGADEPVVRAHVGSAVLGEYQVLQLRLARRARLLPGQGEADLGFRPDAEPQAVGYPCVTGAEDV